MKSKTLIALSTAMSIAVISVPALAEKPDWAGKGKPSAEQKEAHKEAMNVKEKLEDDLQDYNDNDEIKELKEKKEKKAKKLKQEKAEKLSGLEKQQAKKSEQVQNELDKGSEQGQEARKENSKKWWKFWGE